MSSTLTPAPDEMVGETDIQSEVSPSEMPLIESPALSEVNETDGFMGEVWQNWLIQQILYGVLALSFAIIAIRAGKRRA
jgi:tetrahydromethanopterin S-methyltransferase subunit B